MRRTRISAVSAFLLACGTAAILPPAAYGQDQEATASKAPASTGSKARAVTEAISVTFAGGPVTDYIGAIRKSAAQLPVNISVTDEASRVVIPAVNLQSVSLATAVKLLENVTEERGARLGVSMSSAGNTEPAFVVTLRKPGRAGDDAQRLIVSLTDLVNAKGEEPAQQEKQLRTILSAVEAALMMGRERDVPSPEISVHKESGLLLMVGNEEERRTVIETLSQIRSSANAGGGPSKQRLIQLLNVETRDIIEALKEVYPDRFGDVERPIQIEESAPKSIKVTAPAGIMPGVEAVASYVDWARTSPRQALALEQQLQLNQQHFKVEVDAMRAQLDRCNQQIMKLQAELQNSQQVSTDFRIMAEAKERELSTLRDRIKHYEAQGIK